jgi:hypothetical protein
MTASIYTLEVEDNGTLGPLLQAILNKVWNGILFVPGSAFYLPELGWIIW